MFPARPKKMNVCMKTRVISFSQLVTCQDHDMRTKHDVSETSLLVRVWGECVHLVTCQDHEMRAERNVLETSLLVRVCGGLVRENNFCQEDAKQV